MGESDYADDNTMLTITTKGQFGVIAVGAGRTVNRNTQWVWHKLF